ncbi:N-hydroxyarylamine O-acetyltransferase [Mumia flava]|uniref:N-hydroxyarylamine O-acetyltransferase n=1 Tax=Mumia flava TaxID=1348852 RepID=A0A0B2BK23_9ACTN|nr:arylamine N-acetyltransferase [Mumia flava]PJJ56598.1 N-hydroxyarylamine O-acetyltransferase [Mumia flava]
MDPWQVELLDLDAYLARLGIAAREPSRDALDELHEAHVRSFTFDNIDVLLGQHPGVGLDAVQEKFLGRGRGGYCFEHTTLVAAALQRLGYAVTRRLARVGDPAKEEVQGRTHMVVEVALGEERLLCDPGFGMSLLRPIAMDGDGSSEDDQDGWPYRLVPAADPTRWALERLREQGWEVAHTTDELPVAPVDIRIGHHFTSTFPGSHFTRGLLLTKHQPGRHVTVTTDRLTVRRPGSETEHRPLADGELDVWLDELEVGLRADERQRLHSRIGELRR